MIRKAAVVLSLLLFFATMGLWCASWIWWVEIDLPHADSGRQVTITHVGGRVNVMVHQRTPPAAGGVPWIRVSTVSDLEERLHMAKVSGIPMARLGDRPNFEWDSFSMNYQGSLWSGRTLAFPHWLPAVMFALYPALAFVQGSLRRYHRRKKGLCVRCGYNLTGNVSGVCPECGEPVAVGGVSANLGAVWEQAEVEQEGSGTGANRGNGE